MTEKNSIEAIEKQIEDKSNTITKLKKDIPKMIVLVIPRLY